MKFCKAPGKEAGGAQSTMYPTTVIPVQEGQARAQKILSQEGECQHPHGSRIPLTTAQLPGASDTPVSCLSSFLPNLEGQSWRKQVGKDVPGGQEVSSITEEHAVTIAEVTEEEPSLVCSINPDIISCYLTCWSSQQHQEHGLSRLLPARRGHTRQFPVTLFAWQPLILPIFMAVSVRWCPLWTIQTVFKTIMEKEKTKR